MAIHTKKILSLFSGTGGLDLAIKLAVPRSRTVCYVEREAFACAVLVQRMLEGVMDEAPLWTDITSFKGKSWRKKVDIIIGGFPCQPWSSAGKKEKTRDSRWLWSDIEKVIRDVAPNQVFLENVPELCNGGLHHVLGSLATLGFDAEWGVFSAEQIGAPQVRQRLFILGKMANANSFPRPNKNSFQHDRNTSSSGGCLGVKLRKNLFPPRPGEIRIWEKIKEKQPILKPAFCDKVDGDAAFMARCIKESWKKQIRTLGNGIVPVAAAFAYSVLSDRLNAEL